jgi:hypothetical protein
VTVCVPTVSPLRLKVRPLPITPSTLDVHTRLELTSPSSTSLPTPKKVSCTLLRWDELACGRRMVTVGGRTMRKLISAVPCRPPASVASAVTTCRPTLNPAVVKLGPVPMSPSTSEVQRRLAATLPSVASTALPVKVTVAP